MERDDDPDFDIRAERRANKESKSKKASSDEPDRENIIKRTMHALSISEKFTEALVKRMDQSRALLAATTEGEPKPVDSVPITGSKRTAVRSPEDQQSSKKLKTGIGEPKGNQAEYVNAQGLTVSGRQPKLLEGAVMRDYQLDGLDWLMVLDLNGANGILADEMGLGKTLQVISLICALVELGVGQEAPFLVVGPLSTIDNWICEFRKFAPKLPVVFFHGDKNERSKKFKEVSRLHRVGETETYPVVVTSFEMPLKDKDLDRILWRYLIIDEGHRLKNHQCLLIKKLRKYRTVNRLLLTGTPLQNNMTELWSLLNFILPDVVNDMYVFESWFDSSALESSDGNEKIVEAEEKDQVLSTLHKILRPFLLRRVKADVALSIPQKKEIIVYAQMTDFQRQLYSSVIDRSLHSLLDVEHDPNPVQIERSIKKKSNRETSNSQSEEPPVIEQRSLRSRGNSSIDNTNTVSVSRKVQDKILEGLADAGEEFVSEMKLGSPFMLLRKLCNHPYMASYPVIPGTKILNVDEKVVYRSGKLQVMDALLKRLKRDGHKVLIFSTFTQMLDILEDYLQIRKYGYTRLDGSCKLADRKESIEKFSSDDNVFLFLISTRAGGLGINLVAADTVIIFDSDWNPQVDLQAQDRSHRIGQTKPVVVYRLVTSGTIDEQILKRAETKMQLDKLVIQQGKFQNINKDDNIDLKELKELLNSKGAQKVTQGNGCVYTEEELDHLCDRTAIFSENDEMGVNESEANEAWEGVSVGSIESKDSDVCSVSSGISSISKDEGTSKCT